MVVLPSTVIHSLWLETSEKESILIGVSQYNKPSLAVVVSPPSNTRTNKWVAREGEWVYCTKLAVNLEETTSDMEMDTASV